jgi:hypothetical protein
LRVRASSTDLTSSYAQARYTIPASNTIPAFQTTEEAYFFVAYSSGAGGSVGLEMTMCDPFATKKTYAQIMSGSSNRYVLNNMAFVTNTTSYDGFTFYPDSGTVTGTLRVYGYKNGA